MTVQLCHDTTELCHDIKFQTKETSQDKLVTTKVLMLQQTFQRMIRSRQEICHDIFKVSCDIKFRSYHSKERRLCHNKEVLCHNNHNKMLRELYRNIEFNCRDKG